tara:strand:+ start:2993 stop:3211 length:219 start_codon:yes stop_codon:yes gene_type:complete
MATALCSIFFQDTTVEQFCKAVSRKIGVPVDSLSLIELVNENEDGDHKVLASDKNVYARINDGVNVRISVLA